MWSSGLEVSSEGGELQKLWAVVQALPLMSCVVNFQDSVSLSVK